MKTFIVSPSKKKNNGKTHIVIIKFFQYMEFLQEQQGTTFSLYCFIFLLLSSMLYFNNFSVSIIFVTPHFWSHYKSSNYYQHLKCPRHYYKHSFNSETTLWGRCPFLKWKKLKPKEVEKLAQGPKPVNFTLRFQT